MSFFNLTGIALLLLLAYYRKSELKFMLLSSSEFWKSSYLLFRFFLFPLPIFCIVPRTYTSATSRAGLHVSPMCCLIMEVLQSSLHYHRGEPCRAPFRASGPSPLINKECIRPLEAPPPLAPSHELASTASRLASHSNHVSQSSWLNDFKWVLRLKWK